jgi:putative SOS response-associated peptidase YedK
MCGRIRLPTEWSQIKIQLRFDDLYPIPNFKASWNISPTSPVLICRRDPETGKRKPDLVRWGVLPRFEKEPSTKLTTFNAKVEALTTSSLWQPLWSRGQRCLVVSDGFYEWKAGDSPKAPKQPYAVARADGKLTVYAGLWDSKRWQGEIVRSCTIITCTPHPSFEWLHNRQPVILDDEKWPAWLGEASATDFELKGMLVPMPIEGLKVWAVGRAVGNSKLDGAELVEPCKT